MAESKTKDNNKYKAREKLKDTQLKTKGEMGSEHQLPSHRVKELPGFGEWWRDLYDLHKQSCIDAYKEDHCLTRDDEGKPKTWEIGWYDVEKPYYYELYKETLGVYDPKVEEEFEIFRNYQPTYTKGTFV